MRTFAALLVLVGHCFVSHTAAAAQSQDCKLCRDDYAACVKAHTQGACKTNYDICMNHCRKKYRSKNNQPRTGTALNEPISADDGKLDKFRSGPANGQLGPMLSRDVDTLHWGFALA